MRHPYEAIRCPYTHESLFIREHRADNGWCWLYRGKQYASPDDVLDARKKKHDKEVDFGQ